MPRRITLALVLLLYACSDSAPTVATVEAVIRTPRDYGYADATKYRLIEVKKVDGLAAAASGVQTYTMGCVATIEHVRAGRHTDPANMFGPGLPHAAGARFTVPITVTFQRQESGWACLSYFQGDEVYEAKKEFR